MIVVLGTDDAEEASGILVEDEGFGGGVVAVGDAGVLAQGSSLDGGPDGGAGGKPINLGPLRDEAEAEGGAGGSGEGSGGAEGGQLLLPVFEGLLAQPGIDQAVDLRPGHSG